ncbi:MAG: Delta-aminolevulinic acid dehydratase [Alphaproteobacteria bacterium MarineAlpha6_Bin4]|nr:MAG: Delta-aminolevulinic acid dehydratase [Alphaproteobacteria bacterium MarineAlpha6_Bin3]PPR37825.1 MAG: Delta-aminolevulinic acid dehydratase [Alphaproteobacteria bacterium MarineAlpha6_Bin4]|tara:strand:+ start:9289 stop:10293 length:1005 start_codon:yes stop_codon:yes gene_type:complete
MNKRFTIGKFPRTRLRRNRQSPWCRNLVSETNLSVNDLILPLFITEGKKITQNIKSLPSVQRYSIDMLLKKVEEVASFNIPAISIFPYIEKKLKTFDGKEALNKNNLVCRAIKEIKKNFPNIGLICDVALDPYTTHGHDGILKNNYVANDETVEILSQQAIYQAEAGADIIAPSDMMDGRIGVIRDRLDNEGFNNTIILSYSAKFASNFYGPFRDAVGSSLSINKSDKKNYQMDFKNSDEAIREVAMDINEGADMVMIKPALPYLDVITKIKQRFNIPIFAYQVSGEYAILKLGEKEKVLNYEKSLFENLISIKRAGASAIFTYGAIDIAKKIK